MVTNAAVAGFTGLATVLPLWFGKNGIHDYSRVNDDVVARAGDKRQT